MTSANVLQTAAVSGQSVSTGRKTAKPGGTAQVAVSFTSLIQGTAGMVSEQNVPKRQASAHSEEDALCSGKRIAPAQLQTASEKIRAAKDTAAETRDILREKVAEKLGLNENELEEALSDLGVGMFDLLNPQNLAQLFMEVSAGETETDLLLNPQFVDLMQEVTQIVDDFLGQLEIPGEELEEVMAQLNLLGQSDFQEQSVPAESSAGISQMAEVTEIEETPLAAASPDSQTVQEHMEIGTDEADLSFRISSDEKMVSQQSDAFTGDTGSRNENPPGMLLHKTETKPSAGQQAEQVENQQGTSVFPEFMEAQNVLEVPAGTNTYSSIRPLDLIEQIAQNVRVSISQENSSMEMQLNPENLGKIYLQVSAREGAVHATIAAQNEAVRAALESQVAELKDSLNQAGVKVDAVEVTVASHEFEKNLEQNERQQQNEGERQQEKLSGRKNPGSALSVETGEILSEKETLAAKMMQDNGNSVDFTA